MVATHIQLVRSNIIGSSHFYPRHYWTKLLKKIKSYLHKWTSKKGLNHKQVGGPTARSGGNRHQRSRYLQIKHDLLEINWVFLIEDGLCTHSIFHQAQRKKIPSSQQWSWGRILFHKTKNFRSVCFWENHQNSILKLTESSHPNRDVFLNKLARAGILMKKRTMNNTLWKSWDHDMIIIYIYVLLSSKFLKIV